MRIIRGILLLIILLSLTLPTLGGEEYVLLKEIRGDVLHRGKEFFHTFEPATEGMGVYPGETVRVGLGASAELIFPDGIEVLLKSGAEVRLHMDQVGELELKVLQVDEGEVVVKQKEGLLDRLSFEVETPSAIAAVRGTIFRVRSDEWLRTTVSVQRGMLEVSSHNPQSVTLTAGMMTTVDQGQPPLPPFPFTQEEQDLWDEDEDWLMDEEEEEEESLVEGDIQAFYQGFANAYEEKNLEQILEYLGADWTSDTGDNVETLSQWLSTLFRVFDTFIVNISIIEVEIGEEIRVQYSITISATIEAYDYQLQEEGVVEDILTLEEGDLRILYSAQG